MWRTSPTSTKKNMKGTKRDQEEIGIDLARSFKESFDSAPFLRHKERGFCFLTNKKDIGLSLASLSLYPGISS